MQQQRGAKPREIVCPDTGEQFDSIAAAVGHLHAEGHTSATHWTLRDAIARGVEKHGRYWDWRFADGHRYRACINGNFW